jgi:acyl carrier protein
MDKTELKDSVQEIFRDVMELPDLVLKDELKAEDLEQWDSLAHINLISAIERRFRIRFALGELDEMKQVGDLLTSIEQKIT